VAAALFRISSLSSLITAATTPVYFVLRGEPLFAIASLVLGLLIFIMHRENIRRLLRGAEPRIGRGRKAATPQA
jgi:glycerol-3-phosphate acyltransferase PlsY